MLLTHRCHRFHPRLGHFPLPGGPVLREAPHLELLSQAPGDTVVISLRKKGIVPGMSRGTMVLTLS